METAGKKSNDTRRKKNEHNTYNTLKVWAFRNDAIPFTIYLPEVIISRLL